MPKWDNDKYFVHGADDDPTRCQDPAATGAMNSFEITYANLLLEHHKAAREGNEEKRSRIYQASEVFRDLWPDDVKRYEDRFSNNI